MELDNELIMVCMSLIHKGIKALVEVVQFNLKTGYLMFSNIFLESTSQLLFYIILWIQEELSFSACSFHILIFYP